LKKMSTAKSSTFRAINLIGDYWLLLLMREALLGATRYNEFYKRLAITHATLSDRLKRLVEGGLLTKSANADNTNGPEEYRLTDMGRNCYVVLTMIRQWHQRHPDLSGVEWLQGTFVHSECGHAFEPRLACATCGAEVHADDVSSKPGPGAGIEPVVTMPVQRQVKVRKTGAERSISGTVGIESDRWSIMIMAACFSGISRFGDLRERLLMSPHTLSNRLSLLTSQKMLTKHAYSSTPKRYEYVLTAKGKDIYPIVASLMQYGDRWLSSDGPPMLLQHNPCGSSLSAVLQCSACMSPVGLEHLVFGIQ
jgi:DNA-binding HxlR family transcriptional regulator